MDINITPLINALLGILATVITAYLIPWIKSKAALVKNELSENQLYVLKLIAQTVVNAAAQIYEDNDQKLEYALSSFEAICAQRGLSYDATEARAYIEQAVRAVKDNSTQDTF